jgi:tetratricopeptide (TPR) repeat protein
MAHRVWPRRPELNFHEPFLVDAAWAGSEDDEVGAAGLAAFITLRLVDQFASDQRSQALFYQIRAIGEFVDEVFPKTKAVTLLRAIVTGAAEAAAATEPGGLENLLGPMRDFAAYLEGMGRLHHALDIVDTCVDVAGESDVALAVWRGNLLLRLHEVHEALATFESCAGSDMDSGDRHLNLMARVGCARALVDLGRDAEAITMLEQVRPVAEAADDELAEGQACCCLGELAVRAERAAEGRDLVERGLALIGGRPDAAWFLLDLGVRLKSAAAHEVAARVLSLVFDCAELPRLRAEAAVHSIELAALCRDRLAFKRWCHRAVADLDQDLAVLREVTIGRGEAGFGRLRAAQKQLRKARYRAVQQGLDELADLAERSLEELSG